MLSFIYRDAHFETFVAGNVNTSKYMTFRSVIRFVHILTQVQPDTLQIISYTSCVQPLEIILGWPFDLIWTPALDVCLRYRSAYNPLNNVLHVSDTSYQSYLFQSSRKITSPRWGLESLPVHAKMILIHSCNRLFEPCIFGLQRNRGNTPYSWTTP